MRTTLFFENITCVDHAFISRNGDIVGGSYHLSVLLTGDVTKDEHVVVDFSKGKRIIKELIDNADPNIGFDHKLWVIRNHSKVNSMSEVNTRSIDSYLAQEVQAYTENRRINIETPKVKVELPEIDVRFMRPETDHYSVIAIAELEMKLMLERELPRYFDNANIKVNVKLNTTPFKTGEGYMFRYVHGLKDSTSFGCKNIAHGHLSFFEYAEVLPDYRADCEDCQFGRSKIEEYFERLNNTILINSENAVVGDNMVDITYPTPRGDMTMLIDKHCHDPAKYAIFDSETTIEYIAERAYRELYPWLVMSKTKAFKISEGLQKGVYIEVDYANPPLTE